jgi:hypothetical protein
MLVLAHPLAHLDSALAPLTKLAAAVRSILAPAVETKPDGVGKGNDTDGVYSLHGGDSSKGQPTAGVSKDSDKQPV